MALRFMKLDQDEIMTVIYKSLNNKCTCSVSRNGTLFVIQFNIFKAKQDLIRVTVLCKRADHRKNIPIWQYQINSRCKSFIHNDKGIKWWLTLK